MHLFKRQKSAAQKFSLSTLMSVIKKTRDLLYNAYWNFLCKKRSLFQKISLPNAFNPFILLFVRGSRHSVHCVLTWKNVNSSINRESNFIFNDNFSIKRILLHFFQMFFNIFDSLLSLSQNFVQKCKDFTYLRQLYPHYLFCRP